MIWNNHVLNQRAPYDFEIFEASIPSDNCKRIFRLNRFIMKIVTTVKTIFKMPTMTVPSFGFSIPADSNIIVE